MSIFHEHTGLPGSAEPDAAGPGAALEDAERELAVLRAVLSAITAWSSFEEGSERLLRGLAGGLGQMAAVLWVPDRDRLVARAAWSMASAEGEGGLEERIGALRVRRGVGLVGCAWDQLQAVDRLASDRRRLSSRPGSPGDLRATLAVPCTNGEEVLAVVEMYSTVRTELSSNLMHALTRAGGHLGAFLGRRRGELGLSPLTPREVQVLTLAGQGLPARSIAASLAIRAPTVKTHFEHIYRKLEVRGRTAAVAQALRTGLIE